MMLGGGAALTSLTGVLLASENAPMILLSSCWRHRLSDCWRRSGQDRAARERECGRPGNKLSVDLRRSGLFSFIFSRRSVDPPTGFALNVRRIVYLSTANGMPEDSDLFALLESARRSNARSGISGVLLYGSGSFLQVLEGTSPSIDDVFETIKQDPRHRNVIEVLNEEVDRAAFGKWSMAFVQQQSMMPVDQQAFIDLQVRAFRRRKDTGQDHIVDMLVRAFMESISDG